MPLRLSFGLLTSRATSWVSVVVACLLLWSTLSRHLPWLPGDAALKPQSLVHGRNLSITEALECATKDGWWEYNPNPRPQAWDDPLSHCDARWLQENPQHLAGPSADVIQDPATWRVRKSLKYEWRVPSRCRDFSTPLEPITFRHLLSKLNGSLMFVGDSLTWHMFHSLHKHMSMWHRRDTQAELNKGLFSAAGGVAKKRGGVDPWTPQLISPEPCKTWNETGRMSHKRPICKAILDLSRESQRPEAYLSPQEAEPEASTGYGEAPVAYFCRNDFLNLDRRGPGISGNRSVMRGSEFFVPWFDLVKLWNAKAIVLNRGAHPVPSTQFERELEETMKSLKGSYPELLVLYRASSPGHVDCDNYTKPMEHPLDYSSLPYKWGIMREQNALAREIVERYGGVFLDVEWMTSLRGDGHVGHYVLKYDCLHYCVPGPMDAWLHLLHSALLLLLHV